MSFWAILFIVLAIVMAVGPIMLMQPSKKQQRLAALRQSAALLGLSVQMRDYADKNNTRSVAVYSLAVELPKNAPSWHLLKQSYEHDIHFHGHWEWRKQDGELSTQQQKGLQQILDNLPDDIVGLGCNGRMLGVWWLEKSVDITVSDIRALIERCYAVLHR